jgi:hypothetical protein
MLDDYAKAINWFSKALIIREKVLGKEHADTIVTRQFISDAIRNRENTLRR